MADIFSQIIEVAFKVLGRDDALKLQDALKGLGDVGADADAKLAPLVDQLEKLGKTSEQVQEALDLSKRIEANNAALAQAKKALADLNAEFDKTDKSSDEINIAFQQAEKNVKSLASEQLKLQSAFAQSASSLKAAGVNTNDLNASNEQLQKQSAEIASQLTSEAKAAAQAAAGTKDAASGTKQLGEEAKTTGGLFAELRDNLGKIISVAAAVKLALQGIEFGKEAFAEAADVEASLSRVQALAKSADSAFAALGDQIEDSARAANVSTSAAASAAAALAEQGQSAEEIFKTLTPTILLARDANIDLSESAGIVDDTLDQFGKDASEAADVVDKLVVASKGSKDGLAGMAKALKQLSPDAKAIGLDFDHLVSVLGLLQQNGYDAAKAGNALRSIFQDLRDPTSKLSLELSALGDSSHDFGSAIDTIRNAGSKGERALLSLDGATRSLVQFLVDRGPGALNDFAASLQNVQGEALKTREAIDNNLKGAFTSFTNALDALGGGLASTALAPLRDEFQKLADQLNKFAESPAFDDLKKELAGLFEEGVKAFDNFIEKVDWVGFIESVKSGIHDAAETISEFKDDIGAVAAAINTIGSTIGIFTRGIGVAFNALKVAVSESVAVIAALAAKMSHIKDVLSGGFASDATVQLEAIRDAAEKAANEGADALIKNAEKLGANLTSLGGIAETTSTQVDKVGKSTKDAGDAAEKAAPAFGSLGGGFNAVSGAVESAAQALGILPELFGQSAGAIDKLATASDRAHDAIVKASDAANAAHDAYRGLIESGTATAEQLQIAGDAAIEADSKLSRLLETTRSGAPAVSSFADAMTRLGQTQDSLKATAELAESDLTALFNAFASGQGHIEDVRAAFIRWADAVRASVANSDEWEKDTVESTIRVKAGLLGVTDVLDRLGGEKIPPPDFADFNRNVQQATENVEQYKSGVEGITFANKEAASAFEELGGSAGSTGNLLDQLQSDYSKFAAVSQAAVEKFSSSLVEFFNGTGNFSQQAIADGTNIIRAMESAAQAAQLVQAEIDQQRQGVAALAEQYANMSDAAIKAAANTKGGFDQLEASLQGDAAAAREGASAFDLLGAADLSPLSSALDAAAAKVEQLKEQAQQAKDALESIGDSLADQIDELLGNQQDIEQRRFENQLEQIKEEAELAGTLNTSEYNKLVDQAKKLHDLKMQQIKDEQAAQKNKDQGGGGGGPGPSPTPAPAPAPKPTPAPRPAIGATFNAIITSTDPKARDEFGRWVAGILKDLDNRS